MWDWGSRPCIEPNARRQTRGKDTEVASCFDKRQLLSHNHYPCASSAHIINNIEVLRLQKQSAKTAHTELTCCDTHVLMWDAATGWNFRSVSVKCDLCDWLEDENQCTVQKVSLNNIDLLHLEKQCAKAAHRKQTHHTHIWYIRANHEGGTSEVFQSNVACMIGWGMKTSQLY